MDDNVEESVVSIEDAVDDEALNLAERLSELVKTQIGMETRDIEGATSRIYTLLDSALPKLQAIMEEGYSINSDGTGGGAIFASQMSSPDGESGVESAIREQAESTEMARTKFTEKITDIIQNVFPERFSESLTSAVRKMSEDGDVLDLKGIFERSGFTELFGKDGDLSKGIGDATNMAGNIGNLIGALNPSQGGGINLGTLGTAISRFAPALGIVGGAIGLGTAAMGAYSQGLDLYQGARSASIAQTGQANDLGIGMSMEAQALYTGFTEGGLDAKDARSLSQALIAGRAKYGTAEYDEGYEWAINAAQNYNMDLNTAAALYTDRVVKGGDSLDVLNEKLEALSETVEETGMSMSELQKAAESNSNFFTSKTGSQQLGEQISTLSTKYFGENQTVLQSVAGSVAVSSPQFAEIRSRYEASGMDSEQAYIQAAVDVHSMGMAGQRIDVLDMGRGKTVWDYIQDQDANGLREAAKGIKNSGMNFVSGMSDIQWNQELAKAFGVPTERANDVESTVEFIIENFIGEDSSYGKLVNASVSEASDVQIGESGWSDVKDIVDAQERTNTTYDARTGVPLTMSVTKGSQLNARVQSGYTTSENISGDDTKALVGMAAQNDLISDELGQRFSQEDIDAVAKDILSMYEQSGTKSAISNWIQSEQGRAAIEQRTSTYEAWANDTTLNDERAYDLNGIKISLGWKDNGYEILEAKLENARATSEANKGNGGV